MSQVSLIYMNKMYRACFFMKYGYQIPVKPHIYCANLESKQLNSVHLCWRYRNHNTDSIRGRDLLCMESRLINYRVNPETINCCVRGATPSQTANWTVSSSDCCSLLAAWHQPTWLRRSPVDFLHLCLTPANQSSSRSPCKPKINSTG